jgi:hypothetical protein
MKKLLSFIFLLFFTVFASQANAIPPMPPGAGVTLSIVDALFGTTSVATKCYLYNTGGCDTVANLITALGLGNSAYGTIGVNVAAYNANTMISSSTPSDQHITKYNASTGLYDDAGTLVTPGTGVTTAAAIAVNTAGGFVTFGVQTETIATAIYDGGAAALSATNPTHQVFYKTVPFAATITSYAITCPGNIGGSGTNLIFDVWKVTYGADTLPTVSNSMCAAGTKPQLTYGAHSSINAAFACSTATTVAAGDKLAISVAWPTSPTGSYCIVQLFGTRL